MKLQIVIEKIEDGLYIGSCPELPGCHVEAASDGEARELLKIAIHNYVASYKKRHEKIPFRSTEG